MTAREQPRRARARERLATARVARDPRDGRDANVRVGVHGADRHLPPLEPALELLEQPRQRARLRLERGVRGGADEPAQRAERPHVRLGRRARGRGQIVQPRDERLDDGRARGHHAVVLRADGVRQSPEARVEHVGPGRALDLPPLVVLAHERKQDVDHARGARGEREPRAGRVPEILAERRQRRRPAFTTRANPLEHDTDERLRPDHLDQLAADGVRQLQRVKRDRTMRFAMRFIGRDVLRGSCVAESDSKRRSDPYSGLVYSVRLYELDHFRIFDCGSRVIVA